MNPIKQELVEMFETYYELDFDNCLMRHDDWIREIVEALTDDKYLEKMLVLFQEYKDERIESNCECGLQENGKWSEELFEECGCNCRNESPSHLTGENRMNGRTYIVSHCRVGEDSWEVFDNEDDAKAAYQRLLAKAEDQNDLDLISLSAVVESSDYETHPAFEPKNAATSFSDALDAYIKETVTKTVNEQLAEKWAVGGELTQAIGNQGFMTQEDVEECIEDSNFVNEDSLESMLEDCIDGYRFVDRDDVDIMLEDFMHKEAIEQSIEESIEESVGKSVQHEVDVWSEDIERRTASQVRGLVPDVIKHLINDGQIALTTKTASDPINL